MTGGAGGADSGLPAAAEGYWVDENGMPVDEVLRVLIKDWEIRIDGGGKDGAKGISTVKLDGGLFEEGTVAEQRSEEPVAELSTAVAPSQEKSKEKGKDKDKKKEKHKKKSALKKRKNEETTDGDVMQVD